MHSALVSQPRWPAILRLLPRLHLSMIGDVPRQKWPHDARNISDPIATRGIAIRSVDNVECGGLPLEEVGAGGRVRL